MSSARGAGIGREAGIPEREMKQWDTAELRPGSNSTGGMAEQQGCP